MRKTLGIFLIAAMIFCLTACGREEPRKGAKRNTGDGTKPAEHEIKQVDPFEFYKLFHGFWSEVGGVDFINVNSYPEGRGYSFEYGNCGGEWDGYDEILSVELDSKAGTYRVHLIGWTHLYDCDEGEPESHEYDILWLPGNDTALLTMEDGRTVTYQWGFPEDNYYKMYNEPFVIETSQLADRDALVYLSRMSLSELREIWAEYLEESESDETHQVYSVPDNSGRCVIVDGTEDGVITSVKTR